MNLTAVREVNEVMERHVEDSLAILRPLSDCYRSHCGASCDKLSLVDVGTGAGLPGIVLAIARPEWDVTLMESMNKRCVFLEHVVGVIGSSNIQIVRGRTEFDPEIEKITRRNRKLAKQKLKAGNSSSQPEVELEMTERNNNQPCPEDELMEDIIGPLFTRPNSSIVRPPIEANHFDIHPSLITLVERSQFGGEDDEDPHDFVDRFLRICDTIRHQGVSDDAIRLRLFPFAVKGKALRWLDRQTSNSITTWDELAAKFFAQHFSMEKYNRLVNEITNFTQHGRETLCAAWNRFQELIRKCPQYDMPVGKKVRIFFNGMTPESRMIINVAAGGSIRSKTAAQIYELIDSLATDQNESIAIQPKREVTQLGSSNAMLAEQKLLSQQLAKLNERLNKLQVSAVQASPIRTPLLNCECYQEEHETNECPTLIGVDPVQVNGVWYDQRPQQNFQRNQNFSMGNNFQRKFQGGRLNYKSNNYLLPPPIQPKEPSELEKAMLQLSKTTNEHIQATNAFINETRAHHKNQDASIHNLENQIGQLSKQLTERQQGQFPSDTVVNPREQAKAITTRSGAVIAPQEKTKIVQKKRKKEKEKR